MAKKSLIDFTLQGKKVHPSTIKAELIESYEEEMYRTAGALVEDLDKLVENLDKRSTNRGRGFYAVRYNRPLEGLFAESEITKKGIKIFVPVGDKGSPGYKFNLLDQGRPPLTTAKLMKFPSYDGSLTKEGGENSMTLNRKKVTVPNITDTHGKWVSTHHVDGITPRKFFESIIQKRKFKNPQATRFGKIRLKPPKFKWSPGTVEIKVTRNGK